MAINIFKFSNLILPLLFTVCITQAKNLAADQEHSKTFASDPVIAIVDSKPVRISDIENKQINELRHRLYEQLDYQLKKTAVSKLGDKYPEYSVKPSITIKDKQAKAFYQANNLRSRGSYKDLYPDIKRYLEQKAEIETYNTMYAKAVKAGLISSYLTSPNDFLVKAPIGSAYLRGNQYAKVMVLEFSDYQCPFCSRVQPTLAELRRRYKDKVVFGYRHTPLPFHKEADEAAIAVECARDQGKFEAYHKHLFSNPKKQFINDLKKYAELVQVKDLKQFNDCLDQETYRARLSEDMKDAREIGINGAPGFVIGKYDAKSGTVIGEIISGAQPQMVFINAIEKYLK